MSALKHEVGIDPWILHARPSSIVPQYDMAHFHNLSSIPRGDVASEALIPEALTGFLSSSEVDDSFNGAREDGVLPRTQADYTPTTIWDGNVLGLSNEAFIGPQMIQSFSSLKTEGTVLPTCSTLRASTALEHPHASKYEAPDFFTGLVDDLRLAGAFGCSSEGPAQTVPSSQPVQKSPGDSVMSMASQTSHQVQCMAGCRDDVKPGDACAGTTTALAQGGRGSNSSSERRNGFPKRHVTINKGRGGNRIASDGENSSLKRSSHRNKCNKLGFYQSYESVGGEVVPIKPCEGSKTRYKCPSAGCESHFSTSGHARRHSRLHLDLKPFECPHSGCGATFTRRDNCTQHQRVSHRCILHSHRLTKRSGRQQG